ncbi:COR domain-containing protein [Vibrio sp. 1CM7H]|uniref:COR domain-containing protein n=1 Tax=Vibrio sp. 1CM7H TaxID=2929168 RepID=UPI0020C02351|nr:COR domain-containing protein [Vibrio sp. 1CM7H]MCK8064613.1 TIR domain-containing protein [Vibrio sp. 1CM7H]
MQDFHVGFALRNHIEHTIDQFLDKPNDTLSIRTLDNRDTGFDCRVFFPDNIKKCANKLKKLNISNEGVIHKFSNIESLINVEEIKLGKIGASAIEQILELPKLKKLKIKECKSLSERPDILIKISNLDEIEFNKKIYKELLKSNLKIKKITLFTIRDLDDLNFLSELINIGTNFSDITIIIDDDQKSFFKDFDWSKLSYINSLSINSENLEVHKFFIDKLSKIKPQHLELASWNFKSDVNSTLDISPIKAADSLISLTLELYNYNLENTEVIKNLTKLEELDISFNLYQENLDCLGKLTNLKTLAIESKEKNHNFNFLKDLNKLEILSLHVNSDSPDLEVLSNLSSLKELNISGVSTFPLKCLCKLTNLKSLHVNGMLSDDKCKSISFPSITHLTLTGDESFSNIAAFPNLTSLDVFSESQKILDSIEHNCSLKRLALIGNIGIENLSSISTLSNLEDLRVHGNTSLATLAGIEQLTKLSSLFIDNCSNLTSIENIASLDSLRSIFLFDTRSLRMSWPLSKKLFFDKTTISTSGITYCEHIPAELTLMGDIQKIESWYEEVLTQGYESPSAVKVMLLGNGRIGKTQLARRLRGEVYDDTITSTHGIEVFNFQAEHDGNVDIQCWDFGGQDVYLGTHSLFIDNRALYLLLWTPETENTDVVECEEIQIRNRPLSYWLAYLKSLAGKNANVLICQSQCDDASKDQTAPIPQPTPISKVLPLTLSAKLDNGLDIFKPHFKRAVDFQRSQNGDVWIPKSWLRIVEKIEQLKKQSIDTLPYSEYLELCEECYVHAPETLASYLHQSGKVFYRKGCFNNQLILNQQWALQGVYLLLHREDAIPYLLRMGGTFNQETIERLLWKNAENSEVGYLASEDKHLFIEMMTQCGACFKIDDDSYIAPDALPEFEVSQQRIEQTWQGAEPNYHIRLNYDFLHDATMRYLLSKIGENAKSEACYWKYGCCYYDSKHRAKVLFNCSLLTEQEKKDSQDFVNYGQPGYIDIKVQAASPNLIEHLIDSILKTKHLDAKATLKWLKGEPTEKEESRLEQEKKEPFANIGEGVLDPNRKPNVYFSYAWGKNEDDPKQKVCDDIFNKLKSDTSIQIFRDRDSMNSGDSIEAFEKEIGKADFVFMIISEKSLYQSSHCMNELRLVYERAQNEKQEFVSKVIPVIMDDAKIDNPIDRLKVVKNWTQKRDELDSIISEVGAEAAGAESTNQLQIMRSFINSTANALTWIADLVINRTPELQAETAISLLKTRIEQSKQ